jgi:Cupin
MVSVASEPCATVRFLLQPVRTRRRHAHSSEQDARASGVRYVGVSTDVLSDVLRAVRLTGAVYFDFELSSPWVAEAPPSREIAATVMPGVQEARGLGSGDMV